MPYFKFWTFCSHQPYSPSVAGLSSYEDISILIKYPSASAVPTPDLDTCDSYYTRVERLVTDRQLPMLVDRT